LIKEDKDMNVCRFSLMVGSLFAILLANLTGCCCPGDSTKVETQNVTNTKTLGDQLIDLQKAYESGAITEDQYNSLKQKAIDQSHGGK
jgi:hypothetical protein